MAAKDLFHRALGAVNVRVMRASRYRSEQADRAREAAEVAQAVARHKAEAAEALARQRAEAEAAVADRDRELARVRAEGQAMREATEGRLAEAEAAVRDTERRLNAAEHSLTDAHTRLATVETEVREGMAPPGLVDRVIAAEAKLADAARADVRAREVTMPVPLAVPLEGSAFHIKVKIDYPDIFRPNPASYKYAAVEAALDAHRPAVEAAVAALEPFMYGEAMETLPTARVNDVDPHWNNGMFERDDARAAYAMTARHRPRRIIEVGSGNSTKFFRKAIADHAVECELVCVDPVPRAEIKQVADRVVYQHIKDVDLALFESLQPGDFLFWDGSHIVFNGTDTTHFYLSVLPLVRRGVFVHVHDIQLPYEYEAGYSAHYYNEQYMLATLLLNSAEWVPVLPVFWAKKIDLLRNGGASFWMVRPDNS